MSVWAFQPRKYDPPRFAAEDSEELAEMVGTYIGAEQCDGCGNNVYRIVKEGSLHFAQCATDPADDGDEFQHTDPCGAQYRISLHEDDMVVF